MSERQPLDASALRERAGEWLERQDRNDWNDADQIELDAWLAQSSANLVAYWRVEGAWDRAKRLRAVHTPQSATQRGVLLKWRWRIFGGVAATLVLTAVIGLTTMIVDGRSHEQTISTQVGARKIISLRDGSRIELNTDTVLRIDVTADHRLASIDKGEAYFQIAHDAKHPFVVAAGEHRITVLGTKFVVKQNPKRLEVALLDGRIWLDEGAGQHSARGLLLSPGDKVVATADMMKKVTESARDLQNDLGWRRGMLIFTNSTLANVVAEFNRYNVKKLVVADPRIADLKIIGAFPANDVGMFVRASHQLFNLRASTEGDRIILSR